MSTGATLVLAAVYVFKTILRIDNTEYKKAFDSVRKEVEDNLNEADKTTDVSNFFDKLSIPNNMGLLHMILMTTIVGIFENFDINTDMPDLKNYLKNHNVITSQKNYLDIDLKYILRRLRNSVSHYKYTYDGIKFVFEDDLPRGGDYFKAEFTKDELLLLVDEVSKYCVNSFNLKP